jgi:hypothetical protein
VKYWEIMMRESPYLKADRLADVLAALQFLGQHDDYKLSVADWNKYMATTPRSAGEGSASSWETIFREHPEFFRTNDEGLVSLVWRRAVAKTRQGGRPELQPETIATLLDTAVRLHLAAVEAKRADEARLRESVRDRRWWIQLGVSILTALLAFIGVVLAAWLKATEGGG